MHYINGKTNGFRFFIPTILQAIMLHLHNISVLQFKNYINNKFNFNERIIGICGKNGLGKTNLLDAVYYLCFTKSYFGKNEIMHVTRGYKGFRIEGNFNKNDEKKQIVCIVRENNKKEIHIDGEPYKKFSDHIGKFPAVCIAPDDIDLITGISEVRRKFLDTLLCQTDHTYLQNLISYNKILLQRNSLLKTLAESGLNDTFLLETLTEQLVSFGQYIFEYRTSFLKKFLPAVVERYKQIAGTEETIEITYNSQLNHDNFKNLLQANFKKELIVQRTSVGIHKDDIEITLFKESFKNTASQGQRKSMLFAFKLQEMEQLESATGLPPLLLLDDVFEKLDEGRIQNLLGNVCLEHNNQIFITDTHRERLQKSLQQFGLPFQIIELT